MSAFTWPPDPSAFGAIRPARPGGGDPRGGARTAVPRRRGGRAPPRPHPAPRRPARHAGEISFPGGRRDPEDADLARDRAARGRGGDRPGRASEVTAARRAPPHLDVRDQLRDPPLRRPDPRRAALASSRRGRSTPCSSCRCRRPAGGQDAHAHRAPRDLLRDRRLRRRRAPHLGRDGAHRSSTCSESGSTSSSATAVRPAHGRRGAPLPAPPRSAPPRLRARRPPRRGLRRVGSARAPSAAYGPASYGRRGLGSEVRASIRGPLDRNPDEVAPLGPGAVVVLDASWPSSSWSTNQVCAERSPMRQ